MKRTILLSMIALFLLAARPVMVRADWNVRINGDSSGVQSVRVENGVAFVDAGSFCEMLEIGYRPDGGRSFTFTFPGAPVLLFADGAFGMDKGEVFHVPVPPFMDSGRFYVPQDLFIELLERHAPGSVDVNDSTGVFSYIPPRSDILRVEGFTTDEGVGYRILLTRYFSTEPRLADSTLVQLSLDGAIMDTAFTVIEEPPDFAASLSPAKSGSGVEIRTRFPVGGIRVKGPDRADELVLELTRLEDGNEPLSYSERTVYEELAAAKRSWKIDRIIIDPGHGGRDPGAISVTGEYEKNLTLALALRLRDVIRDKLGIDVVMTRDDDRFVPLKERTRIANRSGGKLFISIHFNSARSRNAHGTESYFLAPARTDHAMKVALKENSVIRFEESSRDYVDLTEENYILLAMAQAQFIKESERLAELIQENQPAFTGLTNRGVDQAGFYVLIGASMPAVLFEAGFISNPVEEKRFRSKKFLNKMADGLCEAIREFISEDGT